MNSGAIEKFIDSIKEPEFETNRTNLAVVSKVDAEGVVWVNLVGAEKETPTASTSAEVKSGDVVNVEWRNNKLYIAGNYTNPSAGVIEVRHIVQIANETKEIADVANEVALYTKEVTEQVKKIADNTNQYFWHTQEGTDTGAHITEIPQEDFIADPDNGGGNLLARSNGIAVRDGLAELAVFGADGSQIGKTGTSHIEMDYRSLRMVDGDTNPHTFFHVSDLRDENNEYAYTETFIGNGATTRFSLAFSPKNRNVTVTVSDGSGGAATIDDTISLWLNFETAPSDGAIITVSYVTSSYFAKAYTLGMRKANSVIGPLSTCFGLYCVASEHCSFAEGWSSEANGPESHAEGYKTKANGNWSHAQGGNTVANRAYQVAIGRFNEIDDYGLSTGTRGKYVFIIGNGSDNNARSNALTVDWYGNEVIAGRLTQSSDRRLKKHIAYLDEDAVEFIKKLKPAHFIKDEENHVGFYAQDVSEIDTWDCMTGEMNGFMTLGYTEIIAPLVTYCQKLESRIEQLENKLKEDR